MTKTPSTIIGIVVGLAVGFGLDVLLNQFGAWDGEMGPTGLNTSRRVLRNLMMEGGGAVAGGIVGYRAGSSAPRLTK